MEIRQSERASVQSLRLRRNAGISTSSSLVSIALLLLSRVVPASLLRRSNAGMSRVLSSTIIPSRVTGLSPNIFACAGCTECAGCGSDEDILG
jgi:hypothetical protein